MSRHQIDYESLAQDAMRGLVRTVLQKVAKNGLPGDHHFYISFHTRGAGVSLSKRLLERYPDEMTIVLQNKFTDLKAFEERFEVTLWFDSIAERLSIPFQAIKVFFDPSVPFGHQFDVAEPALRPVAQGPVAVESETALARQGERRGDDRPTPAASVTTSAGPRSRPASPGAGAAVSSAGGRSDGGKTTAKPPAAVPAPVSALPKTASGAKPAVVKPAPMPVASPSAKDKSQPVAPVPAAGIGDKPTVPVVPAATPAADSPADAAAPGKVVALDAFRKKN